METLSKEKVLEWTEEQIAYWESHRGEEVDAAIIAMKDLKLAVASGELDGGGD